MSKAQSLIFSSLGFLISNFFILLVYTYRIALKPFMGSFASCRFDPSCSQYALEALKEYPLIKALPLIMKRLSKCHPCGSYGYDPLPKKSGEKHL